MSDSKTIPPKQPSSNEIAGIVFGVILIILVLIVLIGYYFPGFKSAVLTFLSELFSWISSILPEVFSYIYNNPFFVLGFLCMLTVVITFFVIFNKQFYNKTDKPIFSTWGTKNWIFSLVIVGLLIFIMTVYYVSTNKSVNNSNIPFTTLSVLSQKRFKYILLFTIFLVCSFLFYFYDPWQLSSNYFGQSTFTILFVGVFLLSLMISYSAMFTTGEQMRSEMSVWDYFIKSMMIFGSLGVSGGLIYWLVLNLGGLHSTSSIISFILNLSLILVIFGLVYKIIMSNQFIQTSPFVRFLTNFILYIPCILVSILDLLVTIFSSSKIGQSEIGNRTEIILLIIGVILVILYFTLPYLENYIALQGGKQLLNDPIYATRQTDLASYLQLNDISPRETNITFDYAYGVSFWFYIDSVPTSVDKYMTIFNYGDKPRVQYKSSNNTLIITELPNENPKSKSTTKNSDGSSINDASDYDSNGNRIIYKRPNILLQKWNNLVINYSGGTMDIFYNGELVKSSPNVVPYMTMDTLSVGENNGLNGGICNVVYFKNTLDSNQIYYLYNSVKNKTPPSLYSSTKEFTNTLGTM
jgi:hypothetical protein